MLNVTDWLKSEIKECWLVSREYSTPYLISQLLIWAIFVAGIMVNILVLEFDDVPGSIKAQFLRGCFDAILFLMLSHYLVRGHLKRHFINQPVTIKRSFVLVTLLAFATVLNVALSLRMAELEVFAGLQPENLSFQIDGEEHIIEFDSASVWAVSVFNQFLYYAIWALGYIFWHSIKSRRELQKQMQEVRIQQLTNQLNPHFLFNTLNSIRALIFEDKEKAADLVTQLSELFRTHLQAHIQPTSTVPEEWQIAKQYLDIEKVRLEERLRMSIALDEQLNEQKLPTLTLLTLVENAIKHGIAPNPTGGEITISTQFVDENRWQLLVTNTCGVKSSSVSTGTGLNNTEQRLSLMFGEQASLKTNRSPEKFAVVVELPYV